MLRPRNDFREVNIWPFVKNSERLILIPRELTPNSTPGFYDLIAQLYISKYCLFTCLFSQKINSVSGPSQMLRNVLWHTGNVTNEVSFSDIFYALLFLGCLNSAGITFAFLNCSSEKK